MKLIRTFVVAVLAGLLIPAVAQNLPAKATSAETADKPGWVKVPDQNEGDIFDVLAADPARRAAQPGIHPLPAARTNSETLSAPASVATTAPSLARPGWKAFFTRRQNQVAVAASVGTGVCDWLSTMRSVKAGGTEIMPLSRLALKGGSAGMATLKFGVSANAAFFDKSRQEKAPGKKPVYSWLVAGLNAVGCLNNLLQMP
jgi:hypothetical protein